jgi:hypothetical protein
LRALLAATPIELVDCWLTALAELDEAVLNRTLREEAQSDD